MTAVAVNTSLFIPHVFPNFDEKYVMDVFAQFGQVKCVDFIAKIDRNRKPFNSVYIHFEWWNDDAESKSFQKKIVDRNEEVRVYYDGPWYWIVLENKGKKHVSGDRKPRIDLGDSNVVNSASLYTPEKPVLQKNNYICPEPPKKSYAQAVDESFVDWSEVQRKFEKDIYSNEDVKDSYLDYLMDSEIFKQDQMEDHQIEDQDNAYLAWIEKEWCEIENQMEEIEAELEAEDANLISIDGRYIKEIETENYWMRNEIAQLRAALLNMDYLYQAEAAKSRALNVQFVNYIPNDENV